ncbi:neprilysin-1-like [Amblyomma americanum]
MEQIETANREISLTLKDDLSASTIPRTLNVSGTLSTKVDLGLRYKGGYREFGEFRYFADSQGLEVPLPLRAAAVTSNRELFTASSKDASPLIRPATERLTARRVPLKSRRLKLSRVAEGSAGNVKTCTTASCRGQRDYLQSQLNFSADPCDDLYDFVCGKYKGHPDGPYTQAENDLRSATISALAAEIVPAYGQTAWQKAAGLFQACLLMTDSSSHKLEDLKSWMVSLNLDLLNLNTVPLVDPVDMTVRLAIDIGVAPIFDFWFFDDTFIEGKRAVQFRLSGFQEGWHKKRYELKEESPNKITQYFSDQLRLYPGHDAVKDSKFATLITNYDEALVTIINKHVKRNTMFVIRMIEHMGEQTAPKVMPEQWAHPVAKYTKGMYRGIDMIHFQKELLNALKELLEDSDWGEHGFRTILAWRLFDALSEYVQPAKLVGGNDKQEVCYYHVHEVMQFAMASHYLRPRVSLNTVRRVEDMFSNVRGAFRAALKNSSWLNGTVLEFAHRNLNRIKVRVGSLGRTLDESFVNGHYASFPDTAPSGVFLVEWLKTRSARAQEKWSDQTRIHFNMSRASPYYVEGSHAVIIPSGALLPAFFDPEGNVALNYGGLGSALAHQIMTGYDVTGPIMYCYHENTRGPFNQRVQCLRDSHAKAWLTTRTGKSSDPAEAENMADLVGTATAFEAFRRLASGQQTETFPGLNLTAVQLFFVGHCMTKCKLNSRTPNGRFASARARCNVPAMNVNAFSAAFGCSREARMNPASKCSFWS